MEDIIIQPIGYVRNAVGERKDTSWGGDVSFIELCEEYRSGLEGLSDFSHAIILYHLDKAHYERERHLQRCYAHGDFALRLAAQGFEM